jgi:hypothetical protein
VIGLIAGLVGVVAILCYQLRPTWWWLGAVATIALSHTQPSLLPANAAVAPAIVALFLFSWLLYERRRALNWRLLVGWGALAGVAASTRADVSLVVALTLFLFFIFLLPPQQLWLLPASGLLVFAVTDPFFLISPLGQIHDLAAKASSFYVMGGSIQVPERVFVFSLIAGLGMLLGVGQLFFPRRFGLGLDRPVLAWSLVATLVTGGIYLTAANQELRFIAPFAQFWEVFLAFVFLGSAPPQFIRPALTIGLLAAAQICLLLLESGWLLPGLRGKIF